MLDKIDLTTPAILFSTISLIHVAYTNRFVAISNLIRSLKQRYADTHDAYIIEQINNLRKRLYLIRNMQFYGIVSLLSCIASISTIFFEKNYAAIIFFAIALIALLISIIQAAKEIWISVEALNIELNSIEELRSNLTEVDDELNISQNIKKIGHVTKNILRKDSEHKD